MSEFSTTGGIDPGTSERLLDGARTQVADHGPVGDLLARAAAPGRPEELAGAATVLAAFRAAYPQPVARRRHTLRRALTLKVGAIVAALTVGGVAFAAHSGVLPNPFPIGPQSPVSPSESRPGATTGHSALPSPSGTPSPSGSPSALPSASVPANLHGLCRSFLATADRDKPKATDSPTYAALVVAAAGQDLTGYCTALLAPDGARPSDNPGNGPSPKPSKANPAPSAKRSNPH